MAAEGAERIAKLLARAGVASRRDAEAMIAAGRVAVNGKVIDTPALNVGPRDRVTVDGKPLPERAAPRLWLYHKPAGLVTSARDEKGRPTVFDKLPPDLPRVVSVGRLDLTSEGLLLLTNDGEIKRRLELPSTGWLRRYRVRVRGAPDEARLAPLREGITVEGERFQPMEVRLDRQQGANAWLTVGLREGKNREIRRAMEALGLIVNRLIRVGYGPFQLGKLAPGAVEEVRPRVLRDQLGLDAPDVEGARPGAGRPARAPSRPGADRSAPAAPRSQRSRSRESREARPSDATATAGSDHAAERSRPRKPRASSEKPPRAPRAGIAGPRSRGDGPASRRASTGGPDGKPAARRAPADREDRPDRAPGGRKRAEAQAKTARTQETRGGGGKSGIRRTPKDTRPTEPGRPAPQPAAEGPVSRSTSGASYFRPAAKPRPARGPADQTTGPARASDPSARLDGRPRRPRRPGGGKPPPKR